MSTIKTGDGKGTYRAVQVTQPAADPGKYTLNGWGQTEADFAFFDLAQDKVELKSDGWRTEKIADDPNVYEWWYFDIHRGRPKRCSGYSPVGWHAERIRECGCQGSYDWISTADRSQTFHSYFGAGKRPVGA